MRRVLIILVMLIIGVSALSALDLAVGANAHYASLIQPQDVKDARPEGLALSDFAFGGEVRLSAGLINGSAVALFVPGSDFASPEFRVMTDVGVGITIAILRATLGIGPDFGVAFGDGVSTSRLGGNLRATADIVLGDLSVGLSWFSLISFDKASIKDAFENPYGYLGVAVTKKL